MMRYSRLLLNIFFVSAFTFNGLTQQELSLEECIDIALENNFSLKITQNREAIAANNFTRGHAGLLPGLELRSQFAGNLNHSRQNLHDGSQVNTGQIHNTTAGGSLQGNWMLFDGLRSRKRYRQLEELKDLASLSTRIAVENMMGNLSSEYYAYVQQRQLFANLQYAVDLSRERVRIEQEHFQLGSGSKVSLLQAEVNLNADSSRLERQYEVLSNIRIRLAEIMAKDNLNEVFIPADTSIVIRGQLTWEELFADVMEQNAAILAAKHQVSLSSYELDMVRSARYPFINLSSGYGYTHNTFQSGSIANQQTWGMNYGITLGLNLYDGRNQQRRESNAVLELENRELTLQQTRQEVEADLIAIFNAYTNNLRIIELETQNLEVARENLDIAFERYRLGALSGFELREVQKNLLEAEERLLSVEYQAKMAEISLLQISGKIVDDIE